MIVRASNLEGFRRFRDQVIESYDTEANVVASIDGSFKGNEKTTIGSAFHYIIEHHKSIHANPFNLDVINEVRKIFGVTFSDAQCETALSHANAIYPFTPEVRHKKDFITKYGVLTVTGCSDVIQGNAIRDTKVKFRSPEYLEYYNSYQWRIYLSIFNLDAFYYDLFEVVSYKDGLDVSGLTVKQHEPFECLRYANMETDIMVLINDFMDWINFRNLWNLIETVKI